MEPPVPRVQSEPQERMGLQDLPAPQERSAQQEPQEQMEPPARREPRERMGPQVPRVQSEPQERMGLQDPPIVVKVTGSPDAKGMIAPVPAAPVGPVGPVGPVALQHNGGAFSGRLHCHCKCADLSVYNAK